MNRKEILFLILAVALCFTLAGCGERNEMQDESQGMVESSFEEQPTETADSTPSQQAPSGDTEIADQSPLLEAPWDNAEVADPSPLQEAPLDNPEAAGLAPLQGVPLGVAGGGFTLELPENWWQTDNAIYEDDPYTSDSMLRADVTPSFNQVLDITPKELELRYVDVERAEDVEFGGFGGRCLHIQRNVEIDGMFGFENEIVYLLELDSGTVCITFYPLYGGGGIGAQREEFETLLETIKAL